MSQVFSIHAGRSILAIDERSQLKFCVLLSVKLGRLPRLESLDYRLDLILDSSLTQEVNEPSVELTVGLSEVVDTSMTARADSKVRLPYLCQPAEISAVVSFCSM